MKSIIDTNGNLFALKSLNYILLYDFGLNNFFQITLLDINASLIRFIMNFVVADQSTDSLMEESLIDKHF